MNILFINGEFPAFDRVSGGLRLFTIVKLLAAHGHSCEYCVLDLPGQTRELGASVVDGYRRALEKEGVRVHAGNLEKVLQSKSFDMVFCEFFYVAEKAIAAIRLWQPHARLIRDSVDVNYVRLQAKVDLTGAKADRDVAEAVRTRELSTYGAADLVITVTKEDADTLKRELPDLQTLLIPNIHEISPVDRKEADHPELLFVGAFSHEPNVDAVTYFAREIWLQIVAQVPQVHWSIVGGKPTKEIRNLASERISVMGYVPQTKPYLMRSWVSIAPLRFGAGMKGKVGEAMAAGLPVVTTAYGVQGFDVMAGKHLLIADDASAFAASVIQLLQDRTLRERIGESGRAFIEERFSTKAVDRILQDLTNNLHRVPITCSIPFRKLKRAVWHMRYFFDTRLLWRFRG